MILYCVFFFIAAAISLRIKARQFKLYAFFLSVGLGMLAFHMEVIPASDLSRHYYYVDVIRSQGLSLSSLADRINPGTLIYFWIVSFFPDDAYLPAISVFISYYFMFRLAYNACSDASVSKNAYTTSYLIILMSYNFYLAANGVRMWIVFSVFFYFLYEETVRNRRKMLAWIMYCVLFMFHYGTIVLVIARICALVLRSIKKLKIKSIVIFAICIIGAVLALNTDYFSEYIVIKINGYATYETRGTWQTIIGYVRMTMICCLIFPIFHASESKMKEYFYVLFIVALISVFQYRNYQVILRFGDAVIAASSVAIANYYKFMPLIKNKHCTTMLLPRFLLWGGALMSFVAIVMFDYSEIHYLF